MVGLLTIKSSPSPALNLPQHQGLFKWVSSSYQVAKYWSFHFNINPSNEHSGLISFRMDCLDLLVVQGTLKSLLQHHSSKASVLQCSAFFIVQFSHPYMTTGKTIALTRWTFVGKVMSLRDGNTRPPYLSPEKPICRSRSNRNLHGKNDWFKLGKGIHQGCILSPCLFNFYAEYIIQNAGLNETQAGIKMPGEISITSDTQMIPPLWQKVKRN